MLQNRKKSGSVSLVPSSYPVSFMIKKLAEYAGKAKKKVPLISKCSPPDPVRTDQ